MTADISLIVIEFTRLRRSLPDDPLALSAEMIVLQEGIDLLAAYRSIPDRTTRLLIKALVEEVSPKDGVEHTLKAANIDMPEPRDPDAS